MAEHLIVNDPASWNRVRRAAEAQAALEVERLDQSPSAFGEAIAWALTGTVNGPTERLSPVHRVGAMIGNVPHTTCGEAIPRPKLWLPLSPALAKSLTACPYCEAAIQRAAWESAA